MSVTIDTNILVPAANLDDPACGPCQALIERLASGPDAALMRQHGVTTIYSRDRDFRKYDGITVRDPVA